MTGEKVIKYSEFLKNSYDEILDIVNCMRVGVWITDGEGNVVMVNDESIGTGGLSREELIGKNMTELIEIGYVLDESSILNVINSPLRAEITALLHSPGGATAVG